MAKLPVRGLPRTDSGRLLVRLHKSHRDGINRYKIAKITNNENQKYLNVLILGHNCKDAIFMPYDIRTTLGVPEGGELDFDVKAVRLCGSLYWYVNAPDPAVRIPAQLTLIGIVIGVLGIVLGLISLCK
jgi:hypothetical protein